MIDSLSSVAKAKTTEWAPSSGSPGQPFSGSAVAWSAVFAGAASAAALSLILLILGTGLGLSSISAWSGEGVSAATFGVSTIVWICLMALLSSGLGGYLAGRLRTRWLNTHADEVHFRDTAHGFLAWALATLITASVLASAVGSILHSGVQASASVASGAISTPTTTPVPAAAASVKNDIQANPKQAETDARDAAEKTKKASAHAALWLFVSLLIGAFSASLAATFGGRHRDAY
jgi:hypothetical protein